MRKLEKELEESKVCFYIVRNLICWNDPQFDDEIRFLLNIPAVRVLAHKEVTLGQHNELVRLALTTGDPSAASILSKDQRHILNKHSKCYVLDDLTFLSSLRLKVNNSRFYCKFLTQTGWKNG